MKLFYKFILFFIFKIVGYKNASNLGSNIGRILGKIIRSDKIILKNLNIINVNSNLKIDNTDKLVGDVFSNYGRIFSDYVFLNKFKYSMNTKKKKYYFKSKRFNL